MPKERCARYMRGEELKTVSMAHKASVLCEDVQSGRMFHLITNGTTLNQKKLSGVAINKMVVSVNDGMADSVTEDILKS